MTANKAALLPCPFCGSDAEFHQGHVTQYIMCRNKSCEAMSISSMDARTVIDAWNIRALSPAAAADYVLVPREPTEEMKIVGLQAFVYTAIKDRPENWKDIDHESPEYYLQMGREIMNSGYTDAAYKAMIAAAPKGDKHE